MVLRSGANEEEDKNKQPGDDVWVCKTPIKVPKLDSGCMKEIDMEAAKSFAEVSTLGSKKQSELGVDPSMVTTFLETGMKLLLDNEVVQGLQELITRCVELG